MRYIPYEKMSIDWVNPSPTAEEGFVLKLPWVSMDVDITPEDKGWIQDAVAHLHRDPSNGNVQKFIQELKDYPIFYIKPRKVADF